MTLWQGDSGVANISLFNSYFVYFYFSLSDEDRDNADSLVIKPPQAVIRPSHRDKRAHKRAIKDRYKDNSRKEKKHLYR